MLRALSLTIICFLLSSTVVAGETSRLSDFRELAGLCSGRWSAEITVIADLPGEENKRGSKVRAYREYSWAVDESAMRITHTAGTTKAIEILAFDPVAKKIRLLSVSTGGGVLELELWRKTANTFGWRISGGGTPEGKAYKGEGEWVFAENKKTIKGDVTVGGEKADPLNEVYSRISKSR
jgi:hypothetical protein